VSKRTIMRNFLDSVAEIYTLFAYLFPANRILSGSAGLVSIAFFVTLTAASTFNDSTQSSAVYLELPLLDYPYQIDAAKTVSGENANLGSFLKGYANPSMHLSLAIATDLYSGMHWGIGRLFDTENLSHQGLGKRLLFGLSLCAADALSFWCPGFLGWEHEECHRAIMSRFHVNSFNEMNTFPIGSELVSVTQVRDEDLARFKQENPTDFIRMEVAGSEGEYLLVEKLRQNNFFYNQHLNNIGLYLLATFNSIGYVKMCSIPSLADVATNDANAKEKAIASRDFTGMDFLGWTYDLFRPSEPYANRGIHPSGIGINRYIKTTDLTHEELTYLKKQGNLQFLNLLSPALIYPGLLCIDLNRIPLGSNGLFGTLALHHYLTSFGNDISCVIYVCNNHHKGIVGVHSFQNFCRSFPAIEAQMIDYEKAFFSHSLFISPRIMAGIQPLGQGFMTSKAAFLGLAQCKFEFVPSSKSRINPFVELSIKSKGWVAGDEFLEDNFTVRCGIASRLLK
jgi:hypothetical protein